MTTLGELYQVLPEKKLVRGTLDDTVTGISVDSREVHKGGMFVAVKGLVTDGHRFLDQAAEGGATTLVVERVEDIPDGPAVVQVPDTREVVGLLAATFFGHPSRDISTVAVTGTNGKTTTTYLVESILREEGAGVGVIGTIGYRLGQKTLPAVHTTPEATTLQKLLREMVDLGHRYAIVEVSSHAIALKRVSHLDIDVAVMTNVTQDHLDFHGTIEDYVRTKASFLAGLGPDKAVVINADDPNSRAVMDQIRARRIRYGILFPAEVTAEEVQTGPGGISFELVFQGERYPVRSELRGRYNVYNILAAASVCLALKIPIERIVAGIERFVGIPGRMEPVECGQPFGCFVDYAHTPDAMEQVLTTARAETEGRVITIFGAGGERDREKRPLMGEMAARYSDIVIVTSDNPRSEDPRRIILDIKIGLDRAGFKRERSHTILDRREAIHTGLGFAQSGDTVMILGKGHEDYQIIGSEKHPFDDREVAHEFLSQSRLTANSSG